MPIKVVMADDHPLILDALDRLFQQEADFQVVARCINGEEALTAVRAQRPELLILDLRMPKIDGLEVLRRIQKEELPTRVVLLTAAADDDEVLEAISLGVSGVVLKEMAPSTTIKCARKVCAGEQWLEKGATGRVLEKMIRREAARRQFSSVLTPRELEIIRMVAAALRNREIGEKLFISEGTVKIHLHNIYEKLGVASRTELVLFAQNKGLI